MWAAGKVEIGLHLLTFTEVLLDPIHCLFAQTLVGILSKQYLTGMEGVSIRTGFHVHATTYPPAALEDPLALMSRFVGGLAGGRS